MSERVRAWHPMWLPGSATAFLAGRGVRVVGDAAALASAVVASVRDEAAAAGMRVVSGDARADLVIEIADAPDTPDAPNAPDGPNAPDASPESFSISRADGTTTVLAAGPAGALYGWFHVVRLGARAFADDLAPLHVEPAHALRMLDHWDNMDVHPVMGQVERGYAGGSIFFETAPASAHGPAHSRVRADLARVADYARLLASVGVNRVAINNVNVHAREARLITGADLEDLARVADVFRPWGIRLHASVSFAAPITLGGLATSDPLDPAVVSWWADAVAEVYRAIPDFGGFVVKADSEGQPGPFAYGRDHADGANLLARALAPSGGVVHWRAFVYDHQQDWRDRSTDRARAAYDHFSPLDGRFDDNVIVQVKHGPMDFQTREPVSPVIPAMTRTRIALELQVTQEYTGQQRHAVYLAPMWREILDFRPFGESGSPLSALVRGGMAAVSNVGDDVFWTGHPLAQANLYAYGRLAWDPTLDPGALLDEWAALTFGGAAVGPGGDDALGRGIRSILDDSWRVYESYTAPLGVGFMVTPGSHYGPSVDGYEYSPWGTYHFADRDGVGVDRTVATGTGYAGQYPSPWRETYESLETTPDELVLFFHHVPYGHVLHSGATVIQHIYDTHFDGAAAVDAKLATWAALEAEVPADVFARVTDLLAEQQRSAREWRDQVTTYFFRKSGVRDASGRVIP